MVLHDWISQLEAALTSILTPEAPKALRSSTDAAPLTYGSPLAQQIASHTESVVTARNRIEEIMGRLEI